MDKTLDERKQIIIQLQELSKQISELARIEMDEYQKLEHKSKSGKRKTRRKKFL